MYKKALLAAAAVFALPAAAHSQSSWFDSTNPTWPGFYIGAQGGLNWLLDNQRYNMDIGWTAGGKIGYDFVGPRVELEGMYHYNSGSPSHFVALPVRARPTGSASGAAEGV